MKYLFILGNHPGLSVAEISCKLSPKNYFFLDKQVLQVETKEEFDAEDLISRLGGTVKIAELLQENCADLNEEIKKYLPENWEGKFRFGFSSYGFKRGEIKDIAIKVKKELKNRSISSRWTTSRERNLSSVAVKENKLLEKGKEFIVLRKEGIQLLAETKAVQNFKELSRRDYGRPARDSRSGMIPPKLAQIMINIASGGTRSKPC